MESKAFFSGLVKMKILPTFGRVEKDRTAKARLDAKRGRPRWRRVGRSRELKRVYY